MAVDSSDVDDLLLDLENVNSDVSRLFRTAMQKTVDITEAAVVGRTPVNTGALRGSITTSVTGIQTKIIGQIQTPLMYGLPVERGRRPGKPPPTDAIKLWVIRKLGKTGKDADSTAFLIARAIGRRGTAGAAMFYKGYDATIQRVYSIWDDVGQAILRELL